MRRIGGFDHNAWLREKVTQHNENAVSTFDARIGFKVLLTTWIAIAIIDLERGHEGL